jgi:hypothetical protein
MLRAALTVPLLAVALTRHAPPPEPPGFGPGLHAKIEAFLQRPFETLRRDAVPRGHWIIALSNLSEYCAAAHDNRLIDQDTATRCLQRLVDIGLHRQMRPYRARVATARLGEHGLYLSHLNILLGNYERIVRDGRYAALSRRVSEHLVELSLRDAHSHAPSYPDTRIRWPADQSATLYSLYLYDRNAGTTLAAEPTERWLRTMRTDGVSGYDGLPVSEITGSQRTSHLPRGCAISYTVRYAAAFAPDEARALWQRYKQTFTVDAGVARGFREWPPGVERRADIDSGPIVLGVGAAATGLGLNAARAVGDEQTYRGLKATEALVRRLGGADLDAVGDSILSVSIA